MKILMKQDMVDKRGLDKQGAAVVNRNGNVILKRITNNSCYSHCLFTQGESLNFLLVVCLKISDLLLVSDCFHLGRI